ncbi:hypothetical protein N7471_007103 [Penicillium samsonianum]|uniref:uncharacterized protein n=1 Tax=Penicillium samsonianum TaxID=1882272 RepID=UPI0025465E6C|nr:uncharacterized protein N7471_007103 [Penicillium samsonianum]KAJ6131888.1 hypothetical protein N7471_007103 [Penicillium samsonianum]
MRVIYLPGRSVLNSSASSSSSSASVTTRGFQPHVTQTFDITIAEESVEMLEYIFGLFIPDVVRLIYDRYCNRPSSTPNADDRMVYVSGHLASLNLRQYDHMGHQEPLAYIDLTRQIQEAITDLRFSHVFGTQTLAH